MAKPPITLGELESHLWEAANILRGPVDAADFKTYVFPLLFFKRISDVHDEEYAAALAESGGDEEYAVFPQNYRFQIPEGCHWDDVRVVTTNVGQALLKAMRGIEKSNPETLYVIFGDAGWTNKERLPDSLLRDLMEHFSRINLGNNAIETDILGQAYEYLIKKFADLTNKKAGEFYTPRTVVRLMINILDPHEGETIYDPACGTGGMLLEAVNHVKEAGGQVRTLYGKLYGQEKNLTTEGIEPLLRAGRRDAREPAADAAHRRGVHRLPVLRPPPDDGLADSAGRAGQPQAGAAADAAHGPGGHLPQAATERGRARASHLPVPAPGLDDRTARPGLECGHHIRPDGHGVHVPGSDHQLVQPLRRGLAAVEHARRLLLHGDARRGPAPGTPRGVQHGPGGP